MALIPHPILSVMTYTILHTDAYKIAMALAGYPLRRETFGYVHRRGGPHYMPFDMKDVIEQLRPSLTSDIVSDRQFISEAGYPVGRAYLDALWGELEVTAIPQGTWFFDEEPAFTVTGPSALVSWLEPLVLRLNYPIQVATAVMRAKHSFGDDEDNVEADILQRVGTVTCAEQASIAEAVFDAMGFPGLRVKIDLGFSESVKNKAIELIRVVGDPDRLFEVGMRAATCERHHYLVLQALQSVGINSTSNCALAKELGMTPVGTMGHEHVQRYGSDEAAFRAMRDRVPGPSSFLLDTFDPILSGIPTALDLLVEEDRGDGIRYDSKDIRTQYLVACSMAAEREVTPKHVLEDSFNLEKTKEFESLRHYTGVTPEKQVYGYGGWFSNHGPLTRDKVAAVWKLTESAGSPRMKHTPGKASIPGKPVCWRRQLGADVSGPIVMIGQEGETPPPGWHTRANSRRLSTREAILYGSRGILFSTDTKRIIAQLEAAWSF